MKKLVRIICVSGYILGGSLVFCGVNLIDNGGNGVLPCIMGLIALSVGYVTYKFTEE